MKKIIGTTFFVVVIGSWAVCGFPLIRFADYADLRTYLWIATGMLLIGGSLVGIIGQTSGNLGLDVSGGLGVAAGVVLAIYLSFFDGKPAKAVKPWIELPTYPVGILNANRNDPDPQVAYLPGTIIVTEAWGEFWVGSVAYQAQKGFLVIQVPTHWTCGNPTSFSWDSAIIECTLPWRPDVQTFDLSGLLRISGIEKDGRGSTMPFIVPCRPNVDYSTNGGIPCTAESPYIIVR